MSDFVKFTVLKQTFDKKGSSYSWKWDSNPLGKKKINPKEKNVYIPWYNEELKEKIKIKKELLKDSRIYGRNFFKERLKKITTKK